jgi:Domain of unknown function (DUF4156)
MAGQNQDFSLGDPGVLAVSPQSAAKLRPMRGIAFFALASGLAVLSCGSQLPEHVVLQPGAEAVEIAMEPPSASTFSLVGQVIGMAAANDPTVAQQAAKNDLRNKAAALGATLVTIDEDTGEGIPLQDKTKVKLVGRAYKSVE